MLNKIRSFGFGSPSRDFLEGEAKIMFAKKQKRDITQKEWAKFEWIDVSSMDDQNTYIKGFSKNAEPPDDGYKYVKSAYGEWVRAQTYIDFEKR